MKDTLSEYGRTFQVKVLACLMSDKTYLSQIIDILSEQYFENKADAFICRTIKNYFLQYKDIPTLEVFKVKIAYLEDEVLKVSIVETLKQITIHISSSSDLQYVKEETLNFCKNQTIKAAILDSVDLLKGGRYDEIKNIIDTALKAGTDKNVGLEYADITNIQTRYTAESRDVISTPWDVINDITAGGLGKGDLVVLVAGPGGGKSTSMMNVGINAVKSGRTVIHFTLELYEDYVGKRYDSILTGIPTVNLDMHLDTVADNISKLTGKLYVKHYPTKTASTLTIKSYLDKLKLLGVVPDMIIVDYADLLRPSITRQKRHEELEVTYEELRGIAGEYSCVVLTASQATRDSEEAEIISGDLISGAYAKLMVGDIVFSLARKTTDKISGTGRWHVIKNRFGPDGLTFPSRINMSTGIIQLFEEKTEDGKQTKKDMDSTEVTRKYLANKYDELMNNLG